AGGVFAPIARAELVLLLLPLRGDPLLLAVEPPLHVRRHRGQARPHDGVGVAQGVVVVLVGGVTRALGVRLRVLACDPLVVEPVAVVVLVGLPGPVVGAAARVVGLGQAALVLVGRLFLGLRLGMERIAGFDRAHGV